MRFDGFAGNEETKKLLSSYVDGGRLPHALLLEGPSGSGRRTLARLLAKAMVCTGEGEKPCGVCPACRKAESGNHPDILEVKGDAASGSYSIKFVRYLRENAYILPNESERRVLIFTDTQNMTDQTQNVLLKILEEPPSYLSFILTCENRAQMLSTIRSRTVCVTLHSVEQHQAAAAIRHLLPAITEQEALQSATIFGGNIGQAAAGLSDGSFRRVLELAPQLATAIPGADEIELMRLTGRLEKNKELVDGVLNTLLLIFRDALARRFGVEDDLSACPEAAQALSRLLTREQLGALMQSVEGLQAARLRNINHTLFLTLMCSRLRAAAGR